MINAGTTQDNFILPVPPVGRLPISQDWLDIMKLVRNRTITIVLSSGKNILADVLFWIRYSSVYNLSGYRQDDCCSSSGVIKSMIWQEFPVSVGVVCL